MEQACENASNHPRDSAVSMTTIKTEAAIIPTLTNNFEFRILSRILRKTIPNSLYRSMKQQNQNRFLISVVVKGKEIK